MAEPKSYEPVSQRGREAIGATYKFYSVSD